MPEPSEPCAASADASQIEQAAEILRNGGLVAFPTETVYGLGAHALGPRAVAGIFELKRRPLFDPLIVHVADISAAQSLVTEVPPVAARLMERFWPGPLTLVLPKRGHVPDLVTAGMPSVAVRVPDHEVALRLLRAARIPIAAPSANRFGRVSPTTSQHVRDSFGEESPLVLEAGPCRVGVESTIVALTGPRPQLLRPGGISLEELEEVAGSIDTSLVAPPLGSSREVPLSAGGAPNGISPRGEATGGEATGGEATGGEATGGEATGGEAAKAGSVAAPGMLESHYAPRIPLWLATSAARPSTHPETLQTPGAGRWGLLSLEPVAAAEGFAVVEYLSATGDLREAAANLFATLRKLETLPLDGIYALPVPLEGLGLAIMDRLRRASTGSVRAQY